MITVKLSAELVETYFKTGAVFPQCVVEYGLPPDAKLESVDLLHSVAGVERVMVLRFSSQFDPEHKEIALDIRTFEWKTDPDDIPF